MNTSASSRPRVLTRRYLLRVGLTNLAAAVCAVVAVAWFGLVSHLSEVGYAVATSLIYAYSIGSLCGTLLPLIAVALERRPAVVRFPLMGAAMIALIVAGCVIGSVIGVAAGVDTAERAREQFPMNVRISIAIGLVAGFIVFGYETLKGRLHAAQLQEARAQKLAVEARLSSLESRVHPHFLFNTLNSVSALIHEDPAKAEQTVGRLATLLRFSLDANRNSFVPLEQELRIVRDYLEIEKTRFGDRLHYAVEAPEELYATLVPILSVQTLVENSIKHVISRRREGGEVFVRVRRAGETLAIDVADSGPGFALADAPAEHGLDNLMERLRSLYSDRAIVENVVDERGRATVCVRVPIEAS